MKAQYTNLALRKAYTQVTLALHQMLIDSTISFSASFLTCFAGTRHNIKSNSTHYLSQFFRPQIQTPMVPRNAVFHHHEYIEFVYLCTILLVC